MLGNRYSAIALLCIFFGTYNIIYYEGFIETYFIRLGEEEIAGTALLIQGFFYLATCVALPYTCESSPRRLQFFLAFIGFGICQMLMGPSALFGLYDSEWSRKCEFEESEKACNHSYFVDSNNDPMK